MARKGLTYVCIGDEEIEIDQVSDEDLEKHGYGYLRPKKKKSVPMEINNRVGALLAAPEEETR
jgi:hypothetical protein